MTPAPVRKSLLRRISWLGGDRRLVGTTGLACVALGWTMFIGFGLSYGAFVVVPGVIFFVVLWVARKMFAADPYMIEIVMKQFRYKKYLAPRSDVGLNQPAFRDYTAKRR